MAHVDEYSFGRIKVDGEAYMHDIIVFPDSIKENWWRLEGHLLQLADLESAGVFAAKPEILVVGTGHDGVMKVSEEVRERCRKEKIELVEMLTGDAVKKYNELSKKPGVIGAFHLTC